MRNFVIAASLIVASPAWGQDANNEKTLVDGINEQLGQTAPSSTVLTPHGPSATIANTPSWGVIVRDPKGGLVDVFGSVDYKVTPTGAIEVPGYSLPEGASLEVVPQKEFIAASAEVKLDPLFQPLDKIPDAVTKATDYLATNLCAKKGRPSSLTLTVSVNASGSLFFATVGTEAGSEVSWDFADTCKRYGLEGDGIAFK
ncbi:hypothetical protein ABIA22_002263 [Sinorhizobium fredii]|uniref:hypothetical protein n=1 Tax=Rhizobium fredii TaxID=380 RepID=UPI003515E582